MNTVLNFAISKIDFIEEVNDSLFRKARIEAFATGENAHTLPIDEDVLRRGAKTIYNKPILWKYDKRLDDAMAHEKDEVPCGFIPKEDNPITFKKHEDGRIFIVINALIWTRYSGRLIEIFKRDNNHKDVSIEIVILESDNRGIKPKILEFVIAGITILGEWIAPACKGCHAELLEFSADRKKYENLCFAEKSIKINNSKEAATSGAWSNPRKKLYEPIVKASNTGALFREAYLVNSSDEKDSTMSDHKYPHHVVRDGQLIIHRNGLEAAFQRASQQGSVEGGVKAHLLRHYRELGLSTENFSEFNITEEQFNKYFAQEIVKEESVGGKVLDMKKKEELLCSYFANFTFSKDGQNIDKYTVDEVKEETVVCTDKEFGCKYEFKYAIDEEKEEVKVDMNDCKKMANTHTETAAQAEDLDEEEKKQKEKADKYDKKNVKKMSDDDDDDDEDDEDDDEDEAEKDIDKDKEEINDDFRNSNKKLKKEIKELAKKFAELEETNKAYMAKIQEMSDYEELKKFKKETEEKEKQEAEMAEMDKVMCEIENRGIEMTEDEKKELMSKVKEFSSMDAWANFAKAQILDRIEKVDGTIKIGMPFSSSRKTGSVWDRI